MPPVEKVGVGWVVWAQEKRAVGVLVADVLDARGTLCECDRAILDHGSSTHGMESFELWWCEERGAFVESEIIRDVEFFAQPGNAF
jgi:hypothetical protein